MPCGEEFADILVTCVHLLKFLAHNYFVGSHLFFCQISVSTYVHLIFLLNNWRSFSEVLSLTFNRVIIHIYHHHRWHSNQTKNFEHYHWRAYHYWIDLIGIDNWQHVLLAADLYCFESHCGKYMGLILFNLIYSIDRLVIFLYMINELSKNC